MTIRLTRRNALAATAAALLTPLSAMAAAETGVVLRTIPPSDLKILDPIWTPATITRNHGYMIYDTLFGMDAAGVIQPQMVGDYHHSGDNKTWDFTLRPGLKFSDGTPVKAQDVLQSLARWSQRDSLGQKMYAVLASATAQGDNAFRLTFKEPFGAVLDALGKPNAPVPFIMPEHVAKTPADQQIDDLTGSGPFTLAKEDFRPGDRISYRKNPHYVPRKEPASGFAGGKVVHVDGVEWMILGDPQTQTNALISGQVDMAEVLPAGSYPTLRTNPNIELVSDVSPGGIYAAIFNHKIAPFNNPKITRAALLAVNQEALLRAQTTYRELYQTCRSIYICSSPYASQDTGFFTGKPEFEKARALLKEAGYDGTPVALMMPSDFPFLRVMPQVYGQLLQQAGFKVDLQSIDWATLVARRSNKGSIAQGGWNAFVTYYGAESAGDPLTYTPLTGDGDKGYFGWPVAPKVEELKTDFMRTTDRVRRKSIAKELQTVALDAGLLAPMGQVKGSVPVRRGVISGLLKVPCSMVVYWNVEKKS